MCRCFLLTIFFLTRMRKSCYLMLWFCFVATDVVTVYVFQEPSLLSSLQDSGLTDVVLHALLIKDVSSSLLNYGFISNSFLPNHGVFLSVLFTFPNSTVISNSFSPNALCISVHAIMACSVVFNAKLIEVISIVGSWPAWSWILELVAATLFSFVHNVNMNILEICALKVLVYSWDMYPFVTMRSCKAEGGGGSGKSQG